MNDSSKHFNFATDFINLIPITHILYHIVIKPILNLMFFKHDWFFDLFSYFNYRFMSVLFYFFPFMCIQLWNDTMLIIYQRNYNFITTLLCVFDILISIL